MNNQFYKKYKECYNCIINGTHSYTLACPKSQDIPSKFQLARLYLCDSKFKQRLLRIFDKLFKHDKYRKRR
jgi:hypothetical protein